MPRDSKSQWACRVKSCDCSVTPSSASYGTTIRSAARRHPARSFAVTSSRAACSGNRSHSSSAARRFLRAMRFVYVLLSTTAVYSLGPVTPSMRKPAAVWWPRPAHSRAVCTTRSTTTSRASSSSCVAATCRTAASATADETWNAAVLAGQ
ncbi:Uncharacterised protein [Mycobacteroides abscessus]|nr:Uncharacterised protein [Mycobacteroides abscessus]